MLSKFFRSSGIISLIATIGTITNHAVCSAGNAACNYSRNIMSEGNFNFNESIKSNNPEKCRVIVVRENEQKDVGVLEKVGEVVGATGGLLVGAPLGILIALGGAGGVDSSDVGFKISVAVGMAVFLASVAAGGAIGGFVGKAANSLISS